MADLLRVRFLEDDQHVEDAPGWMRSMFGALPKVVRGRVWGAMKELGPNIRVQAREGSRAVAVKLRDGLWIVGDLPDWAPERFGADAIGAGVVDAAAGGLTELVKLIQSAMEKQRAKREAAKASAEPAEVSGFGCTCGGHR